MMKLEIESRFPSSSSWVKNLAELYTMADVWGALYYGPRGGDDLALPERVRITAHYSDGRSQVLFEGSYPAAVMWTLGIWTIPAKVRLPLEKQFKEALCIAEGDCQEEEDGGEEDSVESPEGGQ